MKEQRREDYCSSRTRTIEMEIVEKNYDVFVYESKKQKQQRKEDHKRI